MAISTLASRSVAPFIHRDHAPWVRWDNGNIQANGNIAKPHHFSHFSLSTSSHGIPYRTVRRRIIVGQGTSRTAPCWTADYSVFGVLKFRNTFESTQLMSINTKSRAFPIVLANAPASQEGVRTVMSLQGGDAFALVDIPDRVRIPLEIDRVQAIVDTLDFVRHLEAVSRAI